jgi:hypothetical protein
VPPALLKPCTHSPLLLPLTLNRASAPDPPCFSPSPSLQLAEAKVEYAEKGKLKRSLEGSIYDITAGSRDTNATLSKVRSEGAVTNALLATLQAATETAHRELVHKRMDLRRYSASYRKLLGRLGRAPDVSVGDVRMDDRARQEEKEVLAAREAQVQAPSYPASEAIDEVMGADPSGQAAGLVEEEGGEAKGNGDGVGKGKGKGKGVDGAKPEALGAAQRAAPAAADKGSAAPASSSALAGAKPAAV